MNQLNESFADLLKESMLDGNMSPGSVISATVVGIGSGVVVVNAGLKSDALIPVEEFFNSNKELDITVGDHVEVAIEAVENGFGETRLSREKAKRAEAWRQLSAAHESGTSVMGVVIERVKGGFTVDLDSVRAFLPGSLVDVRPMRDPGSLEGQELEFKLIKMDKKRNNIVVSRRAVVEAESGAERDVLIESLEEGQERVGIVKNITGCFVEIEDGIEGLVHMSEIDWTNKNIHPAKAVTLGEEVEVMVLEIDEERRRISLGIKQCQENPWTAFAAEHKEGDRITGSVRSITDFGIFIGLTGSIDGLVHLSDIAWTGDSEQVIQSFKKGDEVETLILSIDPERERISLGIKQLDDNPYADFAQAHPQGTEVTGVVKHVTSKGADVLLSDGLNAYLRAQEIMEQEVHDARDHLDIDEELKAKIISVDPDTQMIQITLNEDASGKSGSGRSTISSEVPATATLGDLMKEQIDRKD